MVNCEITWNIAPHTEAKHFILKKYLDAWLPIISRFHGRVIFIDGFAGPGEYIGGKKGSPIIVMNSILNHKFKMKSEFVLLFIEKEIDRCNHLKQVISKIDVPKDIKIKSQVECAEFENVVDSILRKIEDNKSTLAPTFLFIDPFGFSGLPMNLIKRFMENKKCEVLITFMYEEINRFLGNSVNEKSLTSLFGTDAWKEINEDKNLSSNERLDKLHDLYYDQLKKYAGIDFIRSFMMVNKNNKPDYFLFFGTNNRLGLEKMKEAMWKVDKKGFFQFSDVTYNPKQAVLFEITPNYAQLKREILGEFKGKKVKVEEVEDFVIIKTAFIRSHIRKPILSKMEENDEIKVMRSGVNRKGAFPNGKTIITF